MANQGSGISLSQLSPTSEEESSEHSSRSLATLSGGASCIVGTVATGSSSIAKHKKASTSAAGYCILGGDLAEPQSFPASKKPRGRPPGSKNKPKPPVTVTKDDDQALKPVIIEIAAGSDVVETLIQFAHRREVGLTVLSGSGSVANVTLRIPASHAPALTLHGTFTLLSLSGSYISSPTSSSSSSSTKPPPAFPCSSFGICLAGNQGQVFGGIIGGRVVAASLVVVVATLYKNPAFHRLPNNENDDATEVADLTGDPVGNAANASEGGTNNNNNSSNAMALSGFNVASPSPLNCHVPSDVTVMQQWGHPNRPPNY